MMIIDFKRVTMIMIERTSYIYGEIKMRELVVNENELAIDTELGTDDILIWVMLLFSAPITN